MQKSREQNYREQGLGNKKEIHAPPSGEEAMAQVQQWLGPLLFLGVSMSFFGSLFGGHNIMMITYAFGTAVFSGGVDTGFTIAAGSRTIVNQLDMTTGAWTMNLVQPNGNFTNIGTGTLSGANLTGALAAFTGPQVALRDFADYFLTLSGGNFLPTAMGTQPDLWALGDL